METRAKLWFIAFISSILVPFPVGRDGLYFTNKMLFRGNWPGQQDEQNKVKILGEHSESGNTKQIITFRVKYQ